MTNQKFKATCDSCDKEYYIVANPGETDRPIYCPFCGSESEGENIE